MDTKRLQVRLTPEQRRRLGTRAAVEHRSVAAVVRDAIDAYLDRTPRSRLAAAAHLLATEAPVADWEDMKAEIDRGALVAR